MKRWSIWVSYFGSDWVAPDERLPYVWPFLFRSRAERRAAQYNRANMATNGLHYYVKED